MVKNEIIEILKSYIILLRSEGISVDKAFLYGSQLSEKRSSDSDIDLLIVTDNENDDYIAGKIWALTKKVNSKIEPYIIGTKRFYSSDNSPFIDMVKNKGIEIV